MRFGTWNVGSLYSAAARELARKVFYHFPKYHMKIPLGDFNAKVGRENTLKPTIGNESLHQDSNDNGVRIVNFATSKNLVVKSTIFPHRNIQKYTWNSPDGKTQNQTDHILLDRRWHSAILDYEVSGELTVILIIVWWLQNLGKDWL